MKCVLTSKINQDENQLIVEISATHTVISSVAMLELSPPTADRQPRGVGPVLRGRAFSRSPLMTTDVAASETVRTDAGCWLLNATGTGNREVFAVRFTIVAVEVSAGAARTAGACELPSCDAAIALTQLPESASGKAMTRPVRTPEAKRVLGKRSMIVPSSRSAHAHGTHYKARHNTPRRRRSASVKKIRGASVARRTDNNAQIFMRFRDILGLRRFSLQKSFNFCGTAPAT
jgi:hypothetical protein